MSKLCIATYVFGERYHTFIPVYIYSILKAYPEYDVRIYTDKEVSATIKNDLNKLKQMGNFEIITNCMQKLHLSEKALSYDQISKCIRWLFIDESFYHYDYVYAGDIDVFLIKEIPTLLDQHMEHCETLQSCYSNMARSKYIKATGIQVFKFLLKYGLSETIRFIKGPKTIHRLSGAHFFETKTYLPLLEKLVDTYVNELNVLAEKKSKRWNLCTFNNEQLLYELVQDMHLPLPPIVNHSAKEVLEQTNPRLTQFRPYHGLHLGLWRRNRNNKICGDKTIMDHPIYKEYYRNFLSLKTSDSLLEELLQSEGFAAGVIEDMVAYYQYKG